MPFADSTLPAIAFAGAAAAPAVDEALIAGLAADFALRAAEHDAAASFPFENFERLQAAGLLALVDPRAAGGKGGGLGDALAVVGGIARGEPSTALVLVLQYVIHNQLQRSPAWPERLRDRIAASAASDGALINLLRVEPELGTPHRGGLPATVARKVPGGWRLSGTKIYSTGIPALAWLGVWARSEGDEPLVGTWVVPRGAGLAEQGIEVRETWNHIGMRASGSHEVVFHDVFVPDGHVGELRPPAGWAAPDAVGTAWMSTLFSGVYDGIARAARDWLVGFLHARKPTALGAALATVPRLQEALGGIEALLLTNRVLLRSLAAAVDGQSPPPPSESLLVKYTVTSNAIEAVARALEVTGNPGLSRDNPLERHHRDVLCARVHAPQNDMILTGAGRAALARRTADGAG
ncbi:acyl-CoA dehydrogenase family protein [Azospirillum picis]|uniref:Alkylation response protein AidB-like acyl-CoA dehydrogenase n=1 Tax=Azospirillum picis TaxID=488438 RepID=A0ABU0MN26_9PROT|nr:acyl-CoA dehydrogenase family protein [Azospirillum picis]MBP2300770.1 alkylation response protein AidB-like acyl-CoA dehydrogenase [Azospirillum picis]MDQ0534739.1 alkylation response protein AidB-like acyl-CoA dehydrogenase [Azospirillum picis]